MARRKNKPRPRPKYKSAVNALAVAEGVVVGNIWSKATFGMDLIPFLTEGWLTEKSWWGTGSGSGSAYGNVVTLSELIEGIIPGGKDGTESGHKTLGAANSVFGAMGDRLMRSAPRAVLSTAISGIGFKVARDLTKKPRRMLNKTIRQIGLGNIVKV